MACFHDAEAAPHRIVKKFKPEVVVETGDYVCFPVIYAAHRFGVRCYIHEQNEIGRAHV